MQCNKSRLILREMNIQSLRKKAERILSDEILPAVELPYLPQNSVRQRNPIPVSFNDPSAQRKYSGLTPCRTRSWRRR